MPEEQEALGNATSLGGRHAAHESFAAPETREGSSNGFQESVEIAMRHWLPRLAAATGSEETRPWLGNLPSGWRAWQKKLENNVEKSVHFEGDMVGCNGQSAALYELARKDSVKTICETGFNRGFSSLLWLVSNPAAKVYSFDIGRKPVARSADFLARSFVDSKGTPRLTLTLGDSEKTLVEFRAQNPTVTCDLVFVDGGHSERTALSDITHFASMSTVNSTLIVDDALCPEKFCDGPTRAVQAAIALSLIHI